jgi:RND family efflux transporter MFP subunit
MKISHLARRPLLVVLGCAGVAIGSALLFAETRRGAAPGDVGTTGKAEYVQSIASVAPSQTPGISSRKLEQHPVEAVTRPVTLRLTGSLAADEKSDVGSNAQGNVSQTCVDRGSFVKKGDLLLQIDPRDAQYALDEGEMAAQELRVRLGLDESKEFHAEDVPEVQAAKLALDLADRTYRRSENLFKEHATALEAHDQASTEYRSAVHRHRLALLQAKQLYQSYRSAMTHLVTLRKALDDCSIRAPFDGWVAERDVSVGERIIAIFPGAKLVTLLRIDPLRLSLTVPEQEMAQVKAGQTVTFHTDAFPGKTFQGTVRYITPQLTCDSRSLSIEAVVPNPGAVLRPGLFVTAELHLGEQQSELYVPQAAVRSRGDVAAVFVVRGSLVREQIVSLGESAAGRVRIRSGLAPGEIVVTAPEGVRDGDPAKP